VWRIVVVGGGARSLGGGSHREPQMATIIPMLLRSWSRVLSFPDTLCAAHANVGTPRGGRHPRFAADVRTVLSGRLIAPVVSDRAQVTRGQSPAEFAGSLSSRPPPLVNRQRGAPMAKRFLGSSLDHPVHANLRPCSRPIQQSCCGLARNGSSRQRGEDRSTTGAPSIHAVARTAPPKVTSDWDARA
jgi:hypothetical protein